MFGGSVSKEASFSQYPPLFTAPQQVAFLLTIMKQLPWFKFSPADWMMGRISRQSCEVQVAFLRLCCIYWNAECEMTVEHAELECDGYFDRLVALKMVEVIGDKIGIKFLDIQFNEGRQKREKMSNAGKASAEQRFNERSTNVQQTFNERSIEKSREEKNKSREDIRVDKESKGTYTRENFIDDLLGDFKTDTDLRSVTKTWLQKKKVITEKSMQISKAEIQGHNKSEMYAAIMAAADKGWAQLYSRKGKVNGQTSQGKSTALPVGKPSLDPQTIADAKASAERFKKLENRSEGVTQF